MLGKYLYINGKLKLSDSCNTSTTMQAFNYGTAAFEGMKAFYRKSENNWHLFRPDQHYERFKRSAAMLDIDFRLSQDEFIHALSVLIKKNNIKSDLYLRPHLFRDARGVGLTKKSGYSFSVFIQPVPRRRMKSISCCLVPQRRPIDGSYNVKLSGNYLLSFFAQKVATRKGFDTGIMLSSAGYVSEASVMNLFFVDGNRLHTPSLACGALDGITRRSVMQLAREQFRLKVSEGKYRWHRLLSADEIILVGTGSGINHVARLENRSPKRPAGELVARQLRDLYDQITSGRTDLYQEWLTSVR